MSAAVQVGLEWIPVSEVRPSPVNIRWDDAPDEGFVENIRRLGVLQPVVVRRVAGVDGYELVSGHRRVRGCRAAELLQVPAMVRELSDQEALEITASENLQRSDVTPLEQAQFFQVMLDSGAYGQGADAQRELAARLGLTERLVGRRLRLLNLITDVWEAVKAGKMPLYCAEAYSACDTKWQSKTWGQCGASENWHWHISTLARETVDLADRWNTIFPLDQAIGKKPACDGCPLRRRDLGDLFGEEDAGDRCTDAGCHGKKTEGWMEMQRALSAASNGGKVIEWSDYGFNPGLRECEPDTEGARLAIVTDGRGRKGDLIPVLVSPAAAVDKVKQAQGKRAEKVRAAFVGQVKHLAIEHVRENKDWLGAFAVIGENYGIKTENPEDAAIHVFEMLSRHEARAQMLAAQGVDLDIVMADAEASVPVPAVVKKAEKEKAAAAAVKKAQKGAGGSGLGSGARKKSLKELAKDEAAAGKKKRGSGAGARGSGGSES